jgi:serine/threonine protein kinase
MTSKVAIKRIRSFVMESAGDLRRVLREVLILRQLNTPRVVKVVDMYRAEGNMCGTPSCADPPPPDGAATL